MDARVSASRPRLLAVGDAWVTTGFARVAQSVLQQLVGDFEIEQIGVNYRGQEHSVAWPLHATSDDDDLGGALLADLVPRLAPDVVWTIGDLRMQAEWLRRLSALPDPPPLVAYLPVDSDGLDPEQVTVLLRADAIVVYTDYARRVVQGAVEGLAGPVTLPRLEVIPHGVDLDRFYPLGDFTPTANSPTRQRARKALFGEDIELRDAFIVFNGNRNIPRKRIDTTVIGFSRFAKDKPASVRLYLHMGLDDLGWDIEKLCRRHGVLDRLIVTSQATQLPLVPMSQLNLIYNATTVGVNTSVAEAWGLVAFEHAATGAPQVVPSHSGCGELWSGGATLLNPTLTLTTPRSTVDEYLVPPDALAAALEELYSDEGLYERRARAAFELSRRGEYRWAAIGARWRTLLGQVLSQ